MRKLIFCMLVTMLYSSITAAMQGSFLVYSGDAVSHLSYGDFNHKYAFGIPDKDIVKIHIKNIELFHGDMPNNWPNFLRGLAGLINFRRNYY